jgi:hypothetical protein
MSLAQPYSMYHTPLKTLDFFIQGRQANVKADVPSNPSTAQGHSNTNQFVAKAALLGGSTETALGKGTCQGISAHH